MNPHLKRKLIKAYKNWTAYQWTCKFNHVPRHRLKQIRKWATTINKLCRRAKIDAGNVLFASDAKYLDSHL